MEYWKLDLLQQKGWDDKWNSVHIFMLCLQRPHDLI